MWYRVKVSRNIVTPKGKDKSVVEYYLSDKENFAEAGYAVLQYLGGDGEIEDVCLMKNLKPAGNIKYQPTCKVFIVKFAYSFNISKEEKKAPFDKISKDYDGALEIWSLKAVKLEEGFDIPSHGVIVLSKDID